MTNEQTPVMERARNVLLISDHADSGLLLETLLRSKLGCTVSLTSDMILARELARNPDLALVVVDIQSPQAELEFARTLESDLCDALVIFYSNDPPSGFVQRSLDLVVEFVKKPESKSLIQVIGEVFNWQPNDEANSHE